MVGRRHPQEIYLNQVLRKWWEQTHQDQGYPYIRPLYFELEKLSHKHDPTPDELLEHSYFWLSDHSRFWYYQEEEDDFVHLPAILFTDTGKTPKISIKAICNPTKIFFTSIGQPFTEDICETVTIVHVILSAKKILLL
jgi:hypothetical protein